ncbi:isocitrate lyase/PEP mutase family protein [Parafrigoribacterium soli]|uniref:isocitrate lyase/PEP mutase family protein n=1 Tax=Parafrigoribacterium soli TaxID=3144663 RepID=UPI0032ECB731
MSPSVDTSTTAAKAELLRSLHVPGDPLIVTNVWDAVTARTVAAAPGVKALATASHAVSFAHGVPDGEGLSLDQALAAASLITQAVEIPVSVDFEKGYAPDVAALEHSIARLIAAGAAGLNIEDSVGPAKAPLFPVDVATERIATVRRTATTVGVPLVINARVDVLAGGGEWDDMVTRANSYLGAGADVVFVLGLGTEDKVKRALDEIDGKVSVISNPTSVPLKRLAELGVSRVSFGPGTLGLTLAHLQRAAAQLTALGEYPDELGFAY